MGQKLIRARTTGPKILAAATFCILMPFKASPYRGEYRTSFAAPTSLAKRAMLDTDLSSLAFARFSIDVFQKKKKIRVVASIKNNFRRAISEYREFEYREINEKFFETGKKLIFIIKRVIYRSN